MKKLNFRALLLPGLVLAVQLPVLPTRAAPKPSSADFGYPAGAPPSAPIKILLLGHADTVFPKDSAFNTFREKDGSPYGEKMHTTGEFMEISSYESRLNLNRALIMNILDNF